jgi:hypothetical protein
MAYGWIYALYDPRNGELRYIGQTTLGLKERLWTHLTPKNLATFTRHSVRWLAQLRRLGLKPRIEQVAEAISREELDAFEVRFIAEARARGDRLTNHTEGGRGQKGRRHSEAYKLYMSTLMAGRNTNTPEHMAKLAEMKRGVPRSEETKASISKTKRGQPSTFKGHQHTPEAKAKISESRTGQLLKDKHFAYRHDISTAEILRLLENGLTKVQVAAHFETSTTFIHRRLREARRDGLAVPATKHTTVALPEHVV